jgi:NRAMP (natural resistance-associated macrophage protein)-like metal ion transporter
MSQEKDIQKNIQEDIPERKISHIITKHTLQKAGDYWKTLGPGLTTGAADDDPSGIATYSQTGARYGFQLLWLALFTFPLMAVVQEMCARMGQVTGRGLAGNIRMYYSKWILYTCTVLLFIANVFNLGADLGAMAKATQLLLPINFAVLVFVFAIVSLVLQIFTSYKVYAKYLKYLALILLSYVLTSVFVNFNSWELIRNTFIPHITFSKDQLILICAILGTTISPYLFFWQTSQEVEEEILRGKTTLEMRQEDTTREEISRMRVDVWSGMLISNIVMFFIIAVCAATLGRAGLTSVTTAADAAEALRPLAGNGAYLLFALGIIGTGMLAVPVLAGSISYAISESFNWTHGLYHRLRDAYAFLWCDYYCHGHRSHFKFYRHRSDQSSDLFSCGQWYRGADHFGICGFD